MPCVPIDTSASGDTALAAAPGPGRFHRVLAVDLTADGDTTVSLRGGSAVVWKTYGTAGDSVGIVLPESRDRQLDCPPDQPLVLNNSDAVPIAGSVTYATLGPAPNA